MKLSIVLMQPTSLCNLNCEYCYVPDRRDKAIMSNEVLEATIKKVLHSSLVNNDIQFLWHAGEPLLAGKEFYKKMIEIVSQQNRRKLKVWHSIQTNATRIDNEWCDFFKVNEFHIGLSIDGPAFIHDAQRQSWSGKPSHNKVMAGYEKLLEYGIKPGAICVLTRESLKHPEAIFEFFASHGFTSISFNLEETDNFNVQSSLTHNVEGTIEDLRRFMKMIFELQRKKFSHVEIREMSSFFEILAIKRRNPNYFRLPPQVLPLSMITIQKNGDITPYSPEFAGARSTEYGNFVIGNILTSDIDDLPTDLRFMKMRRDVEESVSMCASLCRYFDLCGSAPLSNKYSENGTLLCTETMLCKLKYQIVPDVMIENALLVS